MNLSSRLLTRKEVADALRVHPDTVRRYEQAGKLAGVHLNARNVRYRQIDVDALINQAITHPTGLPRADEEQVMALHLLASSKIGKKN